MGQQILYSDKLVEITGDAIPFRMYYFPFGSKRVKLPTIARLRVMAPTLLNGKWRQWGTGDFSTWFPLDWRRSSRDRIFLAFLADRRVRIGFTVEDSDAVIRILGDKDVPIEREDT